MKSLTENQLRILNFILRHRRASIKLLLQMMNSGKGRAIRRDLQNLQNDGWISRLLVVREDKIRLLGYHDTYRVDFYLTHNHPGNPIHLVKGIIDQLRKSEEMSEQILFGRVRGMLDGRVDATMTIHAKDRATMKKLVSQLEENEDLYRVTFNQIID